jgi:HEXXH motif-containing protein
VSFLLVPAPGEPTTARLAKKVRLLALKTLLEAPGDLTLRRFQLWLARQLKRKPGTLDLLGHPDVLAPLLVQRAGLGVHLDAAIPELLARVIEPDEDLLWDRPFGRVRGCEVEAEGLFVGRSGSELRVGGQPCPLPSPEGRWTVPGTQVELCVRDTNPLSMHEAHPDKQGNAVSLGERPVQDWLAALAEAFELVRVGLPSWFSEMPAYLRRLVPVGYEPELHLSASYREAPGIVWLTLHPDPVTMAEALVHEAQHSKLNLLSWLDPVLHNGQSLWTESPVRPDLRPLMGVLLAAHAFVPVAQLHQGLLEADHPLSRRAEFVARKQQVLETNERSLAILEEHSEASPTGQRLLDDLGHLHRSLA